MSLNPKITVREFTKFRDSGDGASAIAVVNPDGTNIGGSSSSSGGTVFQGTNPWIVSTSSLPTITIGNTINSLVTVNNSQATITLGQMIPAGTNFVGLATVVVGNYINLASGASTLADTLPNPSLQQIATFPYVWFNNNATWERWRQIDSSVVGTTTGRGVAGVGAYGQFDDTSTTTLAENSFGLMRMSANRNQYVTIRDAAGNERGLNIDAGGNLNSLGTVIIGSALPAGSNHVGSVTIFGSITSNTGMTTLFPGPNFIGLTTTVIGSAPTLYAVVNTGAVGVQNSLVTLLNSSNWIGLATVSVGSSPTLFAVVNTSSVGVQNSMVTLLAGPNQIGSVTIANNPTLGIGSNYIGLATVVQANQPSLVASSAYIGLVSTASINGNVAITSISSGVTVFQGTNPWISFGTVNIGSMLPAGTNAIGKLSANSGVDIGDVDVTSISAGTNLIGDVGIQPRTTNGLDTFMASGSDGSSILVATAQAVKASAGKVYGYYLYNPESAVTFVHFYNTASGSVTVGTTSPLFTLQIPPASAANLMSEIGITFGTAITIAATTTAGGNTAPATGVSATIWYK